MRRSSILFIAFTLVVIALLGYVLMNRNENTEQSGNNENQGNTPHVPVVAQTGACGLTLADPIPGGTVSFPLTIHVAVDNTQAQSLGCSWSVFEAQAGNVKVLDANGAEVGMGLVQTTEDWMTPSRVDYYSTITLFATPISKNLTLIFTEDNPSGKLNPNTFSMPVVMQ